MITEHYFFLTEHFLYRLKKNCIKRANKHTNKSSVQQGYSNHLEFERNFILKEYTTLSAGNTVHVHFKLKVLQIESFVPLNFSGGSPTAWRDFAHAAAFLHIHQYKYMQCSLQFRQLKVLW